jgi:molecular chaperone GrpE
VGEQVDPHTMNVIEIADAPDRPPGIVIEEVRRGYWWRAKVLRCAEVRATRPDNS